MSKKVGIIVFMMMLMVVIAGCGFSEKKAEQKLTVAVTIVPEKTFVEAICGDAVDVVVMVPPGNSPANYEPTPKEMEKFNKAKLYFAVGVPTEAATILPKAVQLEKLKLVKLQEETKKEYPDVVLPNGKRDPHIWLSPKRAKVMVDIIAKEMGKIDAANKEKYEKNAQAYKVKLDLVDQELQKAFAQTKTKKFIVFHPAFGYLAADYGLEMIALEENGKEATPKRLQDVISLAKKEEIKAVFYQAEIASKQSEALAREIGGKTVQLEPLAADYIGNLRKMAKLMGEAL